MALPFKSSSFPQPPLQVHFGEDGNHSLEVSLIGDHPPQFTTSDGAGASRSKTLPVAPHSADLPWMRDDAGIEDEDWSAGQSGEEGDDAQVGDLQRGNDRIRRGGSARVDSSRARQSDADAEFDDREEDSGAEAGTGREGDQEEADIMLGDSRNRTGEEGAGMSRRTVAQVWKDTMERRITARSELVSFERLAGKRKEPDFEGRKPSEDRNQAIFVNKQEDRSINLKETLSMNQANLDPEDGNYNNTGGQEGSFSLYDPSSGIQGSGEEEDRAELLEEEKAGASEEEKTGASDEVNTGTSEEEKNGQAEMEKVRKVGKAGQKRKASLTSVSGASNGDGTVVKKAKKKTINVWAKTSSRKGGKKNSSKNGAQQNIASEDCVYLTPVYRNQDKVEDGPNLPILLSRYHKAEKIELTLDRLSAGSTKGYRMARATRGVTDGAWYFEIIVEKLGPTGHTRLGWSTERGDVQAPVGYDRNSYAYRDVDGSKVHMAVREPYGEAYVEGDVIGFYINLPHGAELAPKPPPIVSYKGQPWVQEAKEEPPKIVPGSEISFFRNGVCQGVAFKDINAGRYYPAASMYTLPNEPNCTVRFNFGPDFKLPPVDIGNRPPPQAMFCAPYCGLDGREVVPGSWGGEAYSARVPPSAESQKFVETG